MQEFSLLKEKEIPSLVIWEKYLVYATAFGIAEKVIQQMKVNYPEVFLDEYWEEHPERREKYQLIRFATSGYISTNDRMIPMMTQINRLSNTVQTAYTTSLSEIRAHRSSSSSGGRRWIFWRRRRPEVAEAGMGGR